MSVVTKLQLKHIPDVPLLALIKSQGSLQLAILKDPLTEQAIKEGGGETYRSNEVSIERILFYYSHIPKKLVMAKLDRLQDRGFIKLYWGFLLTPEGDSYLSRKMVFGR